MEKILSQSDSRLIVEGLVNGRAAYFLIDTGASVGLMDYDKRMEYKLSVGKKFPGELVGAGGKLKNVRHCDSFIYIGGRPMSQFLLTDISPVVKAIKRETGIEILGIIGLPQMKFCNIQIDANDNLIILE